MLICLPTNSLALLRATTDLLIYTLLLSPTLTPTPTSTVFFFSKEPCANPFVLLLVRWLLENKLYIDIDGILVQAPGLHRNFRGKSVISEWVAWCRMTYGFTEEEEV